MRTTECLSPYAVLEFEPASSLQCIINSCWKRLLLRACIWTAVMCISCNLACMRTIGARPGRNAAAVVQINVPATIMYATGKEGCGVRKPEPGMWEFFVENLNGGVQPGKYPAATFPFLQLRPWPVLCDTLMPSAHIRDVSDAAEAATLDLAQYWL